MLLDQINEGWNKDQTFYGCFWAWMCHVMLLLHGLATILNWKAQKRKRKGKFVGKRRLKLVARQMNTLRENRGAKDENMGGGGRREGRWGGSKSIFTFPPFSFPHLRSTNLWQELLSWGMTGASSKMADEVLFSEPSFKSRHTASTVNVADANWQCHNFENRLK